MSPGTPTPPSISPVLLDSARMRGTLNMPDPELRNALQNIRRNRNSRHFVQTNPRARSLLTELTVSTVFMGFDSTRYLRGSGRIMESEG
jgi:hypothetical protein